MTRVVESVSVTGTYNVPGFWIDSTTPHTFVGSSRTASGALLTSPGFLYVTVKGPTTTPRPVAECLHCSVSGLQTALAMPALGISVAAPNGPTFDQLNPNAQPQTVRTPFNVDLPAAVGRAVVGHALTAASGKWTNKPTRYAYQWLRCPAKSANPGNYCSPITGATGPSYVVAGADSALYLRVTVAATNASGTQVATSLPVLVRG